MFSLKGFYVPDNAYALKYELDWFDTVLNRRISHYFKEEEGYCDISDIEAPLLDKRGSYYAQLVHTLDMTFEERIVLLLALIPHIHPQVLDVFFTKNKNLDRSFTEFGGWAGSNHLGFLPTGETAAFILAGKNLDKRFEVQKLFDNSHFFSKKNILSLEHVHKNEPFLSGALVISTDYLNRLTSGVTNKPDYNIHFPAKLIQSNLTWDDLVLAPEALEKIEDIKTWIHYEDVIMNEWELERVLKPGYRSLFYGPPGTGKTLTACLIGKYYNMDVYRIDLSMLVSKYIGETEKNLSNLFKIAENKNWILFFDEADALFGKRVQTSTSNDRYANQEISYLLQRIEDYPGVVILATNQKADIDDAFSRRFQSSVYFPMPDYEQRYALWKNMINEKCKLDDDVDLMQIAKKFELSGGAITNVVRYGAIKALQKEKTSISYNDLLTGIKIEMMKDGKTI